MFELLDRDALQTTPHSRCRAVRRALESCRDHNTATSPHRRGHAGLPQWVASPWQRWQPGALAGADAMNVRVGGGDLMQIAGHEVYLESRDGGRTWDSVPNDLPGLDLHAFVVDPNDAEHAWAFAVGHGLFETTDAGRHWELRAP